MDIEIALGLIAVGLVLAIPVSVVILFVSVSGLRRRVATLETRLLDIRRDLTERTLPADSGLADTPRSAASPETAAAPSTDPSPGVPEPAVAAAATTAPAGDIPETVSGPWAAPRDDAPPLPIRRPARAPAP